MSNYWPMYLFRIGVRLMQTKSGIRRRGGQGESVPAMRILLFIGFLTVHLRSLSELNDT